jgi:hypothetical protein
MAESVLRQEPELTSIILSASSMFGYRFQPECSCYPIYPAMRIYPIVGECLRVLVVNTKFEESDLLFKYHK